MWRLKERWKVISPVPVILNRFLALELVLTFGILNAFYMIPCWRIHTGGSLRGPFGLFFLSADDPMDLFSGLQRYVINWKNPPKGGFFMFFGRLGRFFLLFLGFRRPDSQHTLAFHLGHPFQHPGVIETLGEFQQEKLSPLLELDGATLELYISLYLIALFQELFGMLGLEVEIMVIRIGSKPDLFYFRSLAFRLHFLFLLLLLVKELVIINDLTYWRVCIGRYLYQVELLLLRHFQRLLYRIHPNFYIVSNQ